MITVNGEPREVSASTTVVDLVRALDRDPDRPGLAVAVNGEVVPRHRWAATVLEDGDRVEVVTAVQGG